MDIDHQGHFDKIASDYSKASNTWQGLYAQISVLLRPLIQNSEVLDVGNGGYFPYETRDARSVTVLDISPAMLDRIRIPRINKVVGNALDLSPVGDRSQDIVLYILCLHHICGKDLAETRIFLNHIFTAADRVLKPGGSVVIVEPVTGGWVNFFQKMAYGVTRAALAVHRVPMIYFHSTAHIIEELSKSFKVADSSIERKSLSVSGWVDPLGGSFPGILKIPAWTCPTRFMFFRVRKPI